MSMEVRDVMKGRYPTHDDALDKAISDLIAGKITSWGTFSWGMSGPPLQRQSLSENINVFK
jgi:hypothetical protein